MKERIILAPGINGDELLRSSAANKSKGKVLFFENIIRYIRSRFDEAFVRKAVSNL